MRLALATSDIGAAPKVVGLILALHTDADGTHAFPAPRTIAAYAGKTEHRTKADLRLLQKTGWINPSPDGFQLAIPTLQPPQPIGAGPWIHGWLKALIWQPAYTAAERLVGAALGLTGDHMHPGVPLLATQTHLSRRVVSQALGGLRESGVIRRIRDRRSTGAPINDRYVLGSADPAWITARTAHTQ